MNNEWLNAYVLHRRPYRETSYIVDFFTLEEGRISAVAKGVKTVSLIKRAYFNPFSIFVCNLAENQTLKTCVMWKVWPPQFR